MRSPRHSILAGAAVLALLGSATACSSDSSDSTGGTGTGAGKPAAAGKTTKKTKKTTKPAVDACTLLEKDEVEGIIGANGGGHEDGGVGESVCAWENEENYHSITVSVGSPNTAADGKLPAEEELPGAGKSEDGPDGIRFATDGTGTFVIADRVCYVQVVTDPSSKKDRTSVARLVKLIRARTAGKL